MEVRPHPDERMCPGSREGVVVSSGQDVPVAAGYSWMLQLTLVVKTLRGWCGGKSVYAGGRCQYHPTSVLECAARRSGDVELHQQRDGERRCRGGGRRRQTGSRLRPFALLGEQE